MGRSVILILGLFCASCGDVDKSEHLRRGNELFSAGEHRLAAVEFRNAVRIDGKFAEARLRLGDAYVELREFDRATAEYVRAADLLPDDVKVQVKAGKGLLLFGRFEDAKARAMQVLKIAPGNVEGLVLLGNALAGLKDLDGAIAEVEEAVKVAPDRGDPLVTLGGLQVARGALREAEAAFKQALAVQPTSILAHGALANFYWATDRVDEAVSLLNQALAIDARDVSVRRALAAIYINTGRMSEAEAQLKALADNSAEPVHQFVLADLYAGTRRFEEARQRIEAARNTGKATDAQVQIRLARIAEAEGDRAGAYARLDELLAEEKNNAEALTMRAQLLLADGRLDDALDVANAAVKASPLFFAPHYALGQVFLARQQSGDARRAFNEVLRLNPRVVGARIELSRLELESGRVDDSVKLARSSVLLEPRNADSHLALVRGLLAQNKLPEAEARLKVLSKALPQSAAVETYVAAMHLLKGDLAAARASYERVLTLDPKSIDGIRGLVSVELGMKNTTGAVARVEDELRRQPRNPHLLLIAAQTYHAARRPADVERVLLECINVAPSELGAYEALGAFYVQQRRLPDALRRFEEVTARQPTSVPAHTMVAMILQVQGKTADARRRYETILDIDANAAVAANNLAYLYAEANEKLDIAVQLAQTAKSQLPESPKVSDTLGWAYYKRGAFKLAVGPLEESVKGLPQNPIFHFHLGLAYAKVGDDARARASLEQALKLQPDFASADEARRVLTSLGG